MGSGRNNIANSIRRRAGHAPAPPRLLKIYANIELDERARAPTNAETKYVGSEFLLPEEAVCARREYSPNANTFSEVLPVGDLIARTSEKININGVEFLPRSVL